MEKPLHIKIEARAEIMLLRPLDLFVRNLVQQIPGFSSSEDLIDNIELAFNEAYTNVSKHAYKSNQKGPICIEIFVENNCLEIRLEDYGDSFDPDTISEPDFQNLGEGGLGIWFMRHFMDDWIYQSELDGKNVLRLMKKIPCEETAIVIDQL
ncbi:MAG: ATP-binding protein [Desulfomonilaceae bacterium]